MQATGPDLGSLAPRSLKGRLVVTWCSPVNDLVGQGS